MRGLINFKFLNEQKVKMPTECLILYDNNPEKVFYAGQSLSGHVLLTLTAIKSVRGKHLICGRLVHFISAMSSFLHSKMYRNLH